VDNSTTPDDGTDRVEHDYDVDLDDYLDGTAEMLGSIHTHGPFEVGDGMPRREIKYSTDLSKSQVRTRAEQLLEDDILVESHVDVGQAHPEVRYRLKGPAKEIAAACAESYQLFGSVPDDPGRDEFIEVLEHLSRVRREDDVEEQDRPLATLVERVSELEDRMARAEDDREVLHSRSDKGLEWMQMVCAEINSAVDDVNIGLCPYCGEYARLTDEYARGDICDDCR